MLLQFDLNLILTLSLKPITLKQPFEKLRTSQNIPTLKKCPEAQGLNLKLVPTEVQGSTRTHEGPVNSHTLNNLKD